MLKSIDHPIYDENISKIYHCPITGCWIWCGDLKKSGYASGRANGTTKRMHRVIYVEFKGEIPDGLVLDHFACDNKRCVNPDHLRPVTSRENTARYYDSIGRKYGIDGVCAVCGGAVSIKSTTGARWCRNCRSKNLGEIGQREYMKLYMREYYKRNGRKKYPKRESAESPEMIE